MLDHLQRVQLEHGAVLGSYGPAGAPGSALIVQTFGAYEAEYAAIRKGVGILTMPQRSVIELRGQDRLEFLHRILTADVKSLPPGQVRRSFLLDRTGRIQGDLIVLSDTERTLLEVDRLDAPALLEELGALLFGEDVKLIDAGEGVLRLSLHGPQAARLLTTVTDNALADVPPGEVRSLGLGDYGWLAYRRDEVGAPGLHLLLPAEAAAEIYGRLAQEVGGLGGAAELDPKRPIRGRGVGWLAYNTARIEAGTPLYHIDFGPDSLPHETGLVPQAVSLTKGCYRGQEIVARMHHRGEPKRLIVGLRMPDDRLPVSGAEIFDSAGEAVGTVTSSAVSPLLGNAAIALATVRCASRLPGTSLSVLAGGSPVAATVQALPFVA